MGLITRIVFKASNKFSHKKKSDDDDWEVSSNVDDICGCLCGCDAAQTGNETV